MHSRRRRVPIAQRAGDLKQCGMLEGVRRAAQLVEQQAEEVDTADEIRE